MNHQSRNNPVRVKGAPTEDDVYLAVVNAVQAAPAHRRDDLHASTAIAIMKAVMRLYAGRSTAPPSEPPAVAWAVVDKNVELHSVHEELSDALKEQEECNTDHVWESVLTARRPYDVLPLGFLDSHCVANPAEGATTAEVKAPQHVPHLDANRPDPIIPNESRTERPE